MAEVELVFLHEIEPLARELLRHYDDLKALSERLEALENQYAMSSASFIVKWEAGQVGDETDFFEWHALYAMRETARVKIAQLLEHLYAILSSRTHRRIKEGAGELATHPAA